MDESFSRVGFFYGMAFVMAVGKACTLLIWQELLEAWRRRRTPVRVGRKAAVVPQGLPPAADEAATDRGLHGNTAGPIAPLRR